MSGKHFGCHKQRPTKHNGKYTEKETDAIIQDFAIDKHRTVFTLHFKSAAVILVIRNLSENSKIFLTR